jgi:type II secretory pathway pseudopilin PulG
MELMFIIAILAILAAILFPCMVRSRVQGELSSCESNEKNIGTALAMFASDHHGRYPATLGQLTPNYLKVVPTCPAAETDTYSKSYQVNGSVAYTFVCNGKHHVDLGIGADFPQYTSAQGLVAGH